MVNFLRRRRILNNPGKYLSEKVQDLTGASHLELNWGNAESQIEVNAAFVERHGQLANVKQVITKHPTRPWTLDEIHLVAISLASSLSELKSNKVSAERQIEDRSGRIRMDHLNRYFYAKDLAKSPVLDAACGVGYGSHVLAEHDLIVTAVDIDREAIEHGRVAYANGNIQWVVGDLLDKPWGEQKFNTVVSLETIEHLKDPEKAVRLFYESLEPQGKLVCSVPNEEKYPFNPNHFAGDEYPHQRHYTPAEFEALLVDAGFLVAHRGTQLSKVGTVVNGSGGKFLVYTAIKSES